MDEQSPAHPPEQTEANPDLEERLAELYRLSLQEKAIKAEREALRDALVKELDGSRYFIGPDGKKYYAFTQVNEPVEVDLDKLQQLVDDEVFSEVTEVVLDKAKFKQAVAADRVPPEVLVKVARTNPGKPFIKFGDPTKPATNYGPA